MAGERGLPAPRKRFGQHFLTDPRTLDRIVEALAPMPSDTVIEIGPGRGALTDKLAGQCARLIAIEIDRDLVRHLAEHYVGRRTVEVVEGDALEVNWAALANGPYLLAGNLPYYITTPLIFRILESPRPARAVLLVQREVAARLAAPPGAGDYGALSVNVQVTTSVRAVAKVSAGSFHPKPKVDSAIVLLKPLEKPLLGVDEEQPFRKFVQAVFGFRRKQLLRVLRELEVSAERAMAILTESGLDPTARPETVAPERFVQLYRLTNNNVKSSGRGGAPR